jgi:hypothetical protein
MADATPALRRRQEQGRAPGPEAIMRCVVAMQRARDAFAADDELASDEQMLAAALEFDPNILPPDELLRRMVVAIAFCESRRDEAKRFADGMTARRQRYAARAMVLRTELLDIMQALERASFAGSPYGTVYVRAGIASPLVIDEGQIPDEYFQTVRVLDKRKLWNDLKQGVVIDGAVLGNAMPVLAIRGDKPLHAGDSKVEEC